MIDNSRHMARPAWRVEWGIQCRFCVNLDLRLLEHPDCAGCLFGPGTHFFSKDKAEFLQDNFQLEDLGSCMLQ